MQPTQGREDSQVLGDTMMFQRIQGGSFEGIDTHEGHYYKMGFDYMIREQRSIMTQKPRIFVADPFSRNCGWGTHTNDIDPATEAESHMDALLWLESLETEYFDYVLFDPPFSARQATQKYESGHINVYTDPGYVSKCFKQIGRILKPNGRVLKLGYNSSRNSRMLDLEKGWLINFGSNRNDVVMTIWRKNQSMLEAWI
jgi:hypothetical protein